VTGGASAALARQRDWPYLNTSEAATAATPVEACSRSRRSRMAQPISTPQQIAAAVPAARRVMPAARRVMPALAVGAAGLVAMLLLGGLLLWFYYGTAVFFEMMASGISACF
jgi:hypothetical protein